MRSERDAAARLVFIALAIGSLILMMAVSTRYAITTDEPLQSTYGRLAYAYYRSGFSDQSALHFQEGSATPQHGMVFDLICAVAERVSPLTRFQTRHLLNAIVGWVGIVYTARIAGLLGGSRASCLAMSFLLLSPRFFGDAMNNPKDVPFASAYAAAIYYLLCATTELPFFKPALIVKTGLAIGAAIGTRAGGLILLGYFWLVLLGHAVSARIQSLRQWANVGIVGSVVCVLAMLAGVAFWPWAHSQPFVRPFQALSILSDYQFAANFRVLFDGDTYWANSLPRSYIPTWVAITTPVVVLVFAAVSIPLIACLPRATAVRVGFVWLTFAFPILSVLITHPILYNGMRHLLFVYPPFVALAGFAAAELWQGARKRSALAACFVAALALGLWDPLRFSVVNHPLQAVYFNPLIGGVRGALGRYDIDYWANSYGPAIEWIEQEGNFPSDRPVRVSGVKHPTADVVPYYAEESNRIIYDGVWKARQADVFLDVTFGDASTPAKVLARGNILHAVTVDGVPLCLVKAGPAWKPR